jgi:hypothetical protein
VETIFNEVTGADVGNDGLLYVLEAGVSEVRVFSEDGEFVRAFGRPGEGPGELKFPVALGVWNDSV